MGQPERRAHRAPLLIGILLIAQFAAAEVTEDWVALHDNIGGADSGRALAIDSSGNIIVTGSSLGFVPGHEYTYEYATLKYDGEGNLLWTARYDGPGTVFSDVPVGVGVDSADNIYVSGSSPGSGTDLDIATVKYSPDGTELWVRRWNGPSDRTDSALAMVVDASGNVYVTGGSYTPATVTDMITLKYDSNGVLLWSTTFRGGYGTDSANDIALGADGSVYVTGESIQASTAFDWATVKYDADGVQQWVAFVDGTQHGYDHAYALAVDPAGDAYVTGYTVGAGNVSALTTVAYDPDGGQLWANFAPVSDVGSTIVLDAFGNMLVGCWSGRVLSYDPDGAERWNYDFGGGGNTRPLASTVDAAGNWYLTGYEFIGNENIVTVMLDPEGSEVWSAIYAGPAGDDTGRAIALAADGGVIIAGGSDLGGSHNFDFCTIRYADATVGAPAWVGEPAARLLPATPNPFNPRTVLGFELPRGGFVRLDLFDLRGRLVRTLVAGDRDAGAHAVSWDGLDTQGEELASGAYLARLRSGDTWSTQKLLLLR